MEELKSNPRMGRPLRVDKGIYYLRVGTYRIFYHIDTSRKIIYLLDVRHRRAAYRR